MFSLRAPTIRSRPGFSLVLSLLVMSLILLTIITVASFVSIESRLAAQHQNIVRARLNASVSLRLALAHLQQEAGPDRRMTARADIIANTTQTGWTWLTLRNPLWTGVWRSDLQLTPPSWLISGQHDQIPGSQSVNLQGQSDFYLSQWVPWQTDYTYPSNQGITLVGDASASPAEMPSGNYAGKPDGRIVLPRIRLPDSDVYGSYCYWIGDEGVKARLNLSDPRLTPTDGSASTPQLKQEALRGAIRSGNEILPGLATMPLSGMDPRVTHVQQLSLLTNGGGVIETNPPTIVRGLATETTLCSRGVNADSVWGGLKVDLSLAFEMNDARWAASEFGADTTPMDTAGQRVAGVTYIYNPDGTSKRQAYGVTKTTLSFDGTTRDYAPLYSFDSRPSSTTTINTRGPLWDTLRNYHRLYKEVTWVTANSPEINARTHYPNNVALRDSGYGARSHYGRFYNREDTPTGDFLNTTNLHSLPAPRPTKVAVSPYVCRQLLVLGLQNGSGTLRLTVTPIIVLHNPYGINLRLGRKNVPLEPAGMRFSFRKWETLSLNIQSNSSNWTKTLGQLAGAADPASSSDESFRTYIQAEVLLTPGEFRLFSLPGAGTTLSNRSPIAFGRTGGSMQSGLDTRGGVWMNLTNAAGAPLSATTTTTTVRLMNSGVFETRVMLSSWPGDDIIADSLDASSELNTLLTTNLSYRSPMTSPFMSLTFGGITIPPLPVIGAEPKILGVIDQGLRWPSDPGPWPLFSYSNPLAPVTRADAGGRSTATTVSGRAFTSPSYRTTSAQPSGWPDVIQTFDAAGASAYGGLSQTSAGVTSAVYTEVPLAPPLSLAQYTHANFGLRDQDPLFQIAQSFVPLNGANYVTSNYDASCLISNHDSVWMANAALFDRFFLSGAAPVIRRGADVTEAKTLENVLDNFAAGQGKLANPRTRLFAQRDEDTVRQMLRDHRRIAGTILSEGTFNVNSTSVPAWAALLASAKRNALGSADELEPSPTNNARFPRAVRADAARISHQNRFTEPEAWTGLATLSDNQIWILARSIVEEMRNRIRFNHRYQYGIKSGMPVHYVIQNRGAEVPLPFIGLAQFVNRFNCGTFQNDIAWQGCLQNAILRADVAGANLSNRTAALGIAKVFGSVQASANTTLAGAIPYVQTPTNAMASHPQAEPLINRNHMLRAAPTSLTQADILAAVGSSLSTRSDTFVIRCYGDAADPLDSTRTVASCWIEAVVQRIPEFCDPRQPPETEVGSPTDGQLHNPSLDPVNRTLGRRFIILSSRTLNPSDL
ncbi:MAG: hypothetical protein EXS26_02875 [Opitutales bacterium]|nr:hypothetical protein [Opitutales bacterium]